MFTGIIEEVGRVVHLARGARSCELTVRAHTVLEQTRIGDSISVNGVCLTVTTITSDTFSADVMPETLRASTLEGLTTASPVNLERALTLSSRLGGHIVTGHIDTTGTIASMREEGNAYVYRITCGAECAHHIVSKGSVALEGISLTVVSVGEDFFDVSVIPHTRAVTNLASKKIGDAVNIECDIIGKYVEKLMTCGVMPSPSDANTQQSTITPAFLAEHGF